MVEGPNYGVTTLTIVIVAPVIILIFLSGVAILIFRCIHHHQMEHLTAHDAEYGTIDGLIASNVGENTLAVRKNLHLPKSVISLWFMHIECMPKSRVKDQVTQSRAWKSQDSF